MNNKFESDKFVLIKVRYSENTPFKYTYAALKQDNLEKGDMVVVTVGKGTGVDSFNIAEVGSTTEDKQYLPKQYEIKPIVCKVERGNYDKIVKWLKK